MTNSELVEELRGWSENLLKEFLKYAKANNWDYANYYLGMYKAASQVKCRVEETIE